MILSPHITNEFAAEIFFAGLRAGHDALRGGEHGNTKTASDPRDLCCADVSAQAGRADPLEAFDDTLLALILQFHFDGPRELALDCEIADVTLSLQNSGNAFLDS